ncbi:MAG: transposase, partial [Pseudonocardiales bacterium]|nr:transposase [Pseudonocardiales bacterium]
CWPGNTADTTVMAQVRADLRDWKLTRVVWVTDRGFASAQNRRLLQRGGSVDDHVIPRAQRHVIPQVLASSMST